MIGQKFSHYRIIEQIGSGGMGVVYRAYDERLDRTVAIKVLPPGLLAGEAAKKRFRREALALARINHPNIATLYDAGSENDTDYLVMEDIPGITLEERIQAGSLPVGEVLTLAIQICEGLAAAHDRGIIHRDLKPGNMRLTPDGRLKILDFGLAERAAGPSQAGATVTATQAQETSGTIPYMAPEQLQGKPADLRSDLWAVGAVLYEISSGRRPFPGNVPTAIAADIIHKEPATPRYLRPEIPVGLERVILKCLEKNPSSRYVSTRAVLQDLKELSTGTSSPSSPSETPSMEIAHVLFMDIVSYSTLPMDEQEHVLRELQETVRSNREFAAAQMEDRLTRLPTGDGMALVFFGDAEAPVRCALELARSVAEHRTLKVRMGINSGPVYRVADINSNHNVSGAGINMAQRVMDCGDVGHILVSKPVADVLAQVTSWRPALHDLGEARVKHGVRVHIFNLCKDGVGNPEIPKKLRRTTRRPVRLAGVAALVIVMVIFAGRTLLNRRGTSSVEIAEGIPSLKKGKYVAILPLKKVGDEIVPGYLANGIQEDLAAKLFQLKEVHLASSESVEKAAAKDLPLSKFARELGVNLLLQGSLQGNSDQLRVTLSLDDASNGKRLWSQEFLGTAGDWLALEDQIYGTLANALALKPTDEEQARVGAHPTDNVKAYDLYLQGRYTLRNGKTQDAYKEAVGLFEQAIDKDPNFALAYTGLSDSSLRMYGETKNAVWARKATLSAQQAERLSPNLPEVHLSLASVYSTTGKITQAATELKRALELAPNSDEAYRNLGDTYRLGGQSEEAIAAYQKAIAANPYQWTNHTALGSEYLRLGDNANALSEFQKTTEIAGDNPMGYEDIGTVYMREGKWGEAIPQFQKAIAIAPDVPTYSNLGTAYFFLKNYDQAEKNYEKAVEGTPGDEALWGNLGDSYRWLGHAEQARDAYKRAVAFAKMDLSSPPSPTILGDIGLLYAKLGDQAQAVQYIQRARAKSPEDLNLIYAEAQVYVLLGQLSNAMLAFREAVAKGYGRAEIWKDPENAKMRSLPEFVKLVGPSNFTWK
jgi:serine/threonine protein kinase/tetratricopeptide (TPR) repeat protein